MAQLDTGNEIANDDFDWFGFVAALLLAPYPFYVIVRELRIIKYRVTVYERGLHLKTDVWDIALTDIADMHFIKRYTTNTESRETSSFFLLHIKLKDRRCFEMRLSSFDSLFTRITYDFWDGKKAPKMSELVAFYERWNK